MNQTPHPFDRKMLDPFKELPDGISSFGAMKYGLHEGNIDEVRELCARDDLQEAIASAKEAATRAYIGEMARQGYRLTNDIEVEAKLVEKGK